MPIYDYICKRCGEEFEINQKITAPPLKKCPECGGEVKRLISETSFVLKGTGWYVTDYSRKSGGGRESSPDKKDRADVGAEKSTSTKKNEEKKSAVV